MRRAADVTLVAKWRERMSRWQRSGLSITEFCQREQISQPSFFAWRKRLAGQRAVTRRRRARRMDRDASTPRLVQLPAPDWATPTVPLVVDSPGPWRDSLSLATKWCSG